ncbi:MAG: TerC/Alx family metal homeostasis membrane protein [Proteobacteria bacterium]|nr:TerC/Alx family metal homeostasis membrane protein [Pseudomonadota bacterium]
MISQYHWITFNVLIFFFLVLDLGVFNRQQHKPKYKEAIAWTLFWVFVSLAFSIWIYFHLGSVAFFEYITSYKIEKILSLDNVMIFAVIFKSLNIPTQYQHRVLFIGILSAIIMRGLMIFLGVELLERFNWLLYIFGAFLVFTGTKILFIKENKNSLTDSTIWKLCQKIIPLSSKLQGNKFFVIEQQKYKATPLLFALVLIEFSDIIFAVDSLPAIFSITTNPFIIYTSNIFAILGLRSLYFVLAGAIEKIKYLKYALGLALVIVGFKLIFNIHLHPGITFSILAVIFSTSIILSIYLKPIDKSP